MQYLENGLKHDRLLLEYFEDSGETEKANLVKFRIE